MHSKAFLYFTLLGSSVAHSIPLHPRDIVTLPLIKTALKHGADGLDAVNAALTALTAANAKEQLAVVNTALMKLASETSADTKKTKSSGAIGIGEILGLASEAPRNELFGVITTLFQALNKTAYTVGEKRDIIKNSGAVDLVVPGIKAQRQGLVDIVSIVPSQVPSIAKGAINSLINGMMAKASAPPAGAPAAAAAVPAILRRQTTGKGKGTGKGTSGKGGASAAPKSPSGGSSSSSSGGVTLDNLLASPEALSKIGSGIDTALDQLISWLRGTTENLIPPEVLDAIAKMPKGMPKGVPKDGAAKPATPPAAPAPAVLS